MNKRSPSSFPTSQRGIVLVEVLIAILIFSIGLLGIVGLQANMTKATSEAKYRAEAGFLAQQRISAMWLDQTNLANYGEVNTDITAISGLPNGTRSTVRGGASCNNEDSCFIVTVNWQQPGSDDSHSVTTVAHVAGGV